MAVPLAVSTGSVGVAQVADRTLLARWDPDALAAVMPAGMLHWALMSPFLGIAMTVNTFVAQGHRGRQAHRRGGGGLAGGLGGDLRRARVRGGGAGCSRYLFVGGGTRRRWSAFEADYFAVLCMGGLPTVASFALAGWHGGRGQTRYVMGVNIIAAAVNILLDVVLIFGWGPVPALGVKGAAAATGLSFLAACGLYLILLGREPGVLAAWRLDRPLMRRLLRFGVPTGLHLLADIAAITCFTFLVWPSGARPPWRPRV